MYQTPSLLITHLVRRSSNPGGCLGMGTLGNVPLTSAHGHCTVAALSCNQWKAHHEFHVPLVDMWPWSIYYTTILYWIQDPKMKLLLHIRKQEFLRKYFLLNRFHFYTISTKNEGKQKLPKKIKSLKKFVSYTLWHHGTIKMTLQWFSTNQTVTHNRMKVTGGL